MTDSTTSTASALAPHLPVGARGDAPRRALLAGRRVLVIGGGQQTYGLPEAPIGIGRATSVLAAREGAAVVVADLDPDAADDTVAQIDREGGTAFAVQGDSSDEADMERIVDESVAALGGLDAVVFNVGIVGGQHLADTSVDDWDRVMAVNVRSPFLGCKHTLPILPTGASIVMVSSTAARLVSTTEIPAYTTSKAALDGLCAYAAKEAAPSRVRVNVVMAGLIDTSLGRLASIVKPDRDTTPIPLGRQGTAWEVAATTIFLLSDTASYITAQTIVVDGGLTGIR